MFQAQEVLVDDLDRTYHVIVVVASHVVGERRQTEVMGQAKHCCSTSVVLVPLRGPCCRQETGFYLGVLGFGSLPVLQRPQQHQQQQ